MRLVPQPPIFLEAAGFAPEMRLATETASFCWEAPGVGPQMRLAPPPPIFLEAAGFAPEMRLATETPSFLEVQGAGS